MWGRAFTRGLLPLLAVRRGRRCLLPAHQPERANWWWHRGRARWVVPSEMSDELPSIVVRRPWLVLDDAKGASPVSSGGTVTRDCATSRPSLACMCTPDRSSPVPRSAAVPEVGVGCPGPPEAAAERRVAALTPGTGLGQSAARGHGRRPPHARCRSAASSSRWAVAAAVNDQRLRCAASRTQGSA